MGLLLGAFIIILVGVVLLNSVADSVSELDDIVTPTANETITFVTNNTLIALVNNDAVIGSEIVYNQTNKLTVNTHYTMTQEGITFVNQTNTMCYPENNEFNITYSNEGDNYVSDGTSRSLIGLVVLFFALTILSVGYVIVKKAYDNMGF